MPNVTRFRKKRTEHNTEGNHDQNGEEQNRSLPTIEPEPVEQAR